MLKLGLAGTLALAGGAGLYWNCFRFQVTTNRFALHGLTAPLKVALLSDLHYGPYMAEGSVAAWVDATMAESPDLIVLTGDYVDTYNQRPLEPLITELARLRAPLGVLAVWGNHDYVNRGWHAYLERAFAGIGIRVLRNSGVAVRPDLYVGGLDDWNLGQPDFAATAGGGAPHQARLLLTHNPDSLAELSPDLFDLALAGHTHGGQVRLPFVGALITSSLYGQAYAGGWVHSGAVPAYVSRGLGVTMLPARLLCPPELSVFELSPTG